MSKLDVERNEKVKLLIEDGVSYPEIGKLFGISKQRVYQLAKRENYSRWGIIRENHKQLYSKVKEDFDNGMGLEELKEKHKLTPSMITNLNKHGFGNLTERYRNIRDSVIVEEYKNNVAKDVVISGNTDLNSPTRINNINSVYLISSKNGYRKYPKVGNRNKGGLFENPKVLKIIKKEREKLKSTNHREIAEILNKKGFRTPMGKIYTMHNVAAKWGRIKKLKL